MRGDHVLVGFVLGLIAPAIGLLIYALLITGSVRTDLSLRYFLMDMVFGLKRNIAPSLSISLFADVGLFFLFDRSDRHKAMRGVIAAMLVYGIVIVVFIGLWGRVLLS
jgi:hypothetical protein